MSAVAVYSYTHSVTYVADNILKSLKDIIRLSGLDPGAFVKDWDTYLRGVRTWLESSDLEQVILEVYNPVSNRLIGRWDINIVYTWDAGDGNFWTDTDQIRDAILKAGVFPSTARYELLLKMKPGHQELTGWSSQALRSTDGMVKQSLGSTVEHSGLGAQAGYWRNR